MNKNIFSFLALLFLASTIFIGCRSTEEDDPPVETIEVADERTLTQTIYADRTTGNSVNFTTTTPWTAEAKIAATSLSTRSAGENSSLLICHFQKMEKGKAISIIFCNSFFAIFCSLSEAEISYNLLL